MLLYIVVRNRRALAHDLRRSFDGEADMRVIIDRRHGDRRRRRLGVDLERRHYDRRSRGEDADLRSLGWILVEAAAGP